MYHVMVKNKKDVIAEEVLDGLADAVAFGRENSVEGNVIDIYDALQDATGNIMHLHKVISLVMPKEYHKVT
jgi:prephenate dehydratase